MLARTPALLCALALSLAPLGAHAQPSAAAPSPPPSPAAAARYGAYAPAADPDPVPRAEWRSKGGALTASLGDPRHRVVDAMVLPTAPGQLEAKLTYGAVSKDLEGEVVAAFVAAASGWRSLGRAVTDDDGFARFPIPAEFAAEIGRHRVQVTVVGDGSRVAGWLRILPAGTRLALFDIDGTLTVSDTELFQELLRGAYRPVARAGSVAFARLLAARGYELVYVTGRPYWLDGITRAWLDELGYPPGHLVLAPRNRDIRTSVDGVGRYKLRTLQALQAKGYVVDYAFGNADTDLWAYLEAGLPPERVFVLGEHGGERGTRKVGEDYRKLVEEMKALPQVTQPFAR